MRRLHYRPSKGTCIFDGILGLVFGCIGIFCVIPSFGSFGILWTLMALGMSVYSFCMAAGKIKIGSMEIEDENLSASLSQNDPENQLESLRNLYDRSLITEEEYEEKRRQILEKL